MWHASSNTLTRLDASDGCSNEGAKVDDNGETEMPAPSSLSMQKWQVWPSHVNDDTAGMQAVKALADDVCPLWA